MVAPIKVMLAGIVIAAAGCAAIPVRSRPLPSESEEYYGVFITYSAREYALQADALFGHDARFIRWADGSGHLYIDDDVFIEDRDANGSVDEYISERGRRAVFGEKDRSVLRVRAQRMYDRYREALYDDHANAAWHERWDTCGGRCDGSRLFVARTTVSW